MAFDIKKEINEMKYYLSNKLKSSIENKDKAKNKIKSKTKGKDKLLINKIHTLWTKYYAKFYKTLNIPDKEQALIKMYSNYKALKVIGNVCKEILDETNDGEKVLSDEEIREFMGALDVAKLAKEQKKFELRAKHGKFSIKDGEAKVAEILNTHEKMSTHPDSCKTEKWYYVMTPFGKIRIDCKVENRKKVRNENEKVDNEKADNVTETRMIRSANANSTHLSYKTMANSLDELLLRLNKQTTNNLIICIKNYINQKINIKNIDGKDAHEILKSLNVPNFVNQKELSEKELECAAVLCGCLLFAESSEVRNPTRGKFEKKAIKKVKRLIEQECTNPFGVVFANESPCYYDDAFYSRKEPTSTYTPAKSKPKHSGDARTVPPYYKGGQYQTEWLITGKANIKRDILPEKQIRQKYDKLIISFDSIMKIEFPENKDYLSVNSEQIEISNTKETQKIKSGFQQMKEALISKNIQNIITNFSNTKKYYGWLKSCQNKRNLLGVFDSNFKDGELKSLISLYLASNKSHEFIKIKNIPDDFKAARNHMLESIKENRKNLHELNKK